MPWHLNLPADIPGTWRACRALIRRALDDWYEAVDSGSADREHEAGMDLAALLETLLNDGDGAA